MPSSQRMGCWVHKWTREHWRCENAYRYMNYLIDKYCAVRLALIALTLYIAFCRYVLVTLSWTYDLVSRNLVCSTNFLLSRTCNIKYIFRGLNRLQHCSTPAPQLIFLGPWGYRHTKHHWVSNISVCSRIRSHHSKIDI